ncbi:LOW QUALITY PROTEIN: lipase lipl-5-like [Homarus americanus]|uniref:LOW QUALITY PROTEIN: lipase lipl-5-like n=1 Tax=Homarus americanus TaxID=6706 RepID=UPI001C48079B|nr:LOW QUALITY PROTEIN: lipase lipl-5-like [Homarus americanus]
MKLVVLAAVLAGALCLPGLPFQSDHWGANLTTPELIEAFGYPAEVHTVTTEDGYILELHRIPFGRSGPSPHARPPPVYLQHGLLGSSADWVMNQPDEALALILVDAGYDVWLGNARGNTYSRNHVDLSPSDIHFWEFSWDEIALLDLPAAIDYILATTGVSSLRYVGFSMGTTTYFAMMSKKPEYNEKVKVMAALAPVAYLANIESPIKELAPYSNEMDMVLTLLGVGEFMPSSKVMDYFAEHYCNVEDATAQLCYNILFLLCGPDPTELDKEWLPSILAHTPAGTSVHTVNHYGQLVNSGNFTMYNYGVLGNIKHYGQVTPPLYNISHVTSPFYWSDNDWLADYVQGFGFCVDSDSLMTTVRERSVSV